MRKRIMRRKNKRKFSIADVSKMRGSLAGKPSLLDLLLKQRRADHWKMERRIKRYFRLG